MKDPDTIVRALRPAALDELADDAHAGRRDADLARAMNAAAGRRPRPRPRRVGLLVAGVAAAACAAAGLAVVSGGDGAAPGGTTTARGPVDARTFLLASAKTAERSPAKVGRYWYNKILTQEVTDWKSAELSGNNRAEKVPYMFRLSRGEESWHARAPDAPSRTITGIDARVTFPTKEDEAAWRRAGSEPLVPPGMREPTVNNYDMPFHYGIGNGRITMPELRKLPVDAKRLKAELRRRHTADAREIGEEFSGNFTEYVFSTASDLLAGPLTPGTKAAMYRMLADLPGVKSEGRVTDPLGRPGVAVSMDGSNLDGDYHSTLIVDPRTAEVLVYEGGFTYVHQEMGWVNELGARP
ncbi:CU044_5270 family protein [Actinomadura sp. 7K507]|uniref:CU044_5270 family protein n=1 Tax=Actinomadura sp. 7K507 TaxID=2530365 RepID=UPI001053DFA7|nr:CU044_5270 family protein [Actinomadura sp. 7K507]TDC90631.1 hypothetical protein E1285_14355 [Actinomadura sp. 7K507]